MDDHGVEYQPLEDTYSLNNSIEGRERKYWILCLVVFFLEILAGIGGFGYFIDQTTNHNAQGYNVIPLVYSLIGLAVLSNGLFGNLHRGVSLIIYVILFEVVPGVVKSIALIVLIFGYKILKDEIQKIIEEEHWNVSATTILTLLILLTSLSIFFHLFCGTVVYRYRTIRRQREYYF